MGYKELALHKGFCAHVVQMMDFQNKSFTFLDTLLGILEDLQSLKVSQAFSMTIPKMGEKGGF